MGFGKLEQVVRVAGGLWALGVLVGGCSSDSEKRPSLSLEDFVSGVCEEYEPCCGAAQLPTDGARCREFYESILPQAGFDGAAARGCLDAYRTLRDKCTGYLQTPACDAVFAESGGSKQPGEDCESASDCALPKEGSVSCAFDFGADGSSVQKCQVELTGVADSSPCVATKAGNLRVSEGDLVPSGYVCDLAAGIFCDGGSLACRPLFEVGEACYPNTVGCVSSAYCDTADSKCHPRAATGEACDDGACVAGNFCDETRKCAPALAAGASCTGDIECLSRSCVTGKCEAEAFASQDFLCGNP
jgi:hypothetical protein